MAASFPNSVKTWTPLVDHVSTAQASDINTVYEEITAIETELSAGLAYSTEAESSNSIVTLPSTAQGLMSEFTVEGNTVSPYDSYTKFLMRFEGSDGAKPSTDATGKALTWSGDAQLDTAQKKFGSSSALFDGTDYIIVTDANNELDIGTQDFCLEGWFRVSTVAGLQHLFDFRQSAGTDIAPVLYITSGYLRLWVGDDKISSTSILSAGIWYHIAVVRSNGTTKMFVNGGQVGSNYTDTNNYISVTTIKIGSYLDGNSYQFYGHMDDIRISVGTPRYTENFTPQPLDVLSVAPMAVEVIGKNNVESISLGSVNVTTGALTTSTTEVVTNLMTLKDATSYFFGCNATYRMLRVFEYDVFNNYIGFTLYGGVSGTDITTNAKTRYVRVTYDKNGATLSAQDLIDMKACIQVERGTIASIYEAYQKTTATNTQELHAVPSAKDTWNALTGEIVKRVSDVVELNGNDFTWGFVDDYIGFKLLKTPNSSFAEFVANSEVVYKYNNKLISHASVGFPSGDYSQLYGANSSLYLSVFDIDTGWLESWTSGGGFTGLDWNGLAKSYMNGWKLTLPSADVASCVWTGIASGTTKSGASGYADTTTTLDVGFTPYSMYYELATPITTYTRPTSLQSSASGTLYQKPLIEDYGFYNGGLALSNTDYLISSIQECRLWDLSDGSYTIIPTSNITITAGVITAITGAVAEQFYTFDYIYADLSTNANLVYTHPINAMGQIQENTNAIIRTNEKIDDLEKTVIIDINSAEYSDVIESTESIIQLPEVAGGFANSFIAEGVNSVVEITEFKVVAQPLVSDTSVLSMAVYNGKIYAITAPNLTLLEWNGTDAWVEVVSSFGTSYGGALTVANNKLYFASEGGELYEWNDVDTLTQVATSSYFISAVTTFDNKVYAGTGSYGRLLEWNGTNAWVIKASVATSGTAIYNALCVFNNKLYAGLYPSGELAEWNGVDAWVIKSQSITNAIYGLVVFNGKLYGNSTDYFTGSVLLEWDGVDTWVEALTTEYVIVSMIVLDNKLYLGTYNGCLLEWDGVSAALEIVAENPLTTSNNSLNAIATLNNKVYGGDPNGKLLEKTPGATEIKFGGKSTILGVGENSTTLTSIPVLRSIPIAKDTYNVNTGEHIQVVGTHALTVDDVIDVSEYVNVDVYFTTNEDTDYGSQNWIDGSGAVLVDGYEVVPYAEMDNVSSIGKFVIVNHQIGLIVAKGASYETLLGINIYFELTDPITTFYDKSEVQTSSSGTIEQQNRIDDFGWYADGLALTNPDYPIYELIEVKKWNISDGTYTDVLLEEISVTYGEITYIDASPNDFFTFSYKHKRSVNANLVFTHPVTTAAYTQTNTESIINQQSKIEDLQRQFLGTKPTMYNNKQTLWYWRTALSANAVHAMDASIATTISDTSIYPMPQDGCLVGIIVTRANAITAGTLSIQPRKLNAWSGSQTTLGSPITMVSGDGAIKEYTYAVNSVLVSAGDLLSIRLDTDASYDGGTSNHTILGLIIAY